MKNKNKGFPTLAEEARNVISLYGRKAIKFARNTAEQWCAKARAKVASNKEEIAHL
ncbi:hypothetical protein GTO36_09765, partial [bacterium]|nr:hypothetical protein [bacterium]